jgi:galactokinase
MSDFQRTFGVESKVAAAAPGRVNLIGEHTDYNGGLVLPAPLGQHTRVELAPRLDKHVRVLSLLMPSGPVEFTLGEETPRRGWIDYVQGVTHFLMVQGSTIRGFDALVDSDIPVGSGLSSSAALSVSLLRALRSAFSLTVTDTEIAVLGQRSENDFVGARVGIMDPLVCSLAKPGYALFIDARSLDHEDVPLPKSADVVVINSGIAHRHAAGDYNTRRAECERACALLGISQLRDLTADDLPRINALPEPLNRRARHVVTENERVLAAVKALRADDMERLGQLFNASHVSQRDDYQVSIPEIDWLVETARKEPDVYGARLTGGGFGGSVVLLTRASRGEEISRRVGACYAQHTGATPTILLVATP